MGGYCSRLVHKETAVVLARKKEGEDTYQVTFGHGKHGTIISKQNIQVGETISVWVDDETGEIYPPFYDPFPSGEERAYATQDGKFRVRGNPCKSINAATKTGYVVALLLGMVLVWSYAKKKITVLQTTSLATCLCICCVLCGQVWFTRLYNSFVYHETKPWPPPTTR